MLRRFLLQSHRLVRSDQPSWTAVGVDLTASSGRILGNAVLSGPAPFSSQAVGDYQTLRCEIDKAVGKITISRPKALNAVSMEVCLIFQHLHHGPFALRNILSCISTKNEPFADTTVQSLCRQWRRWCMHPIGWILQTM